MRRPSASSVSWQRTPNWAGVPISWRAEKIYRGMWIGWLDGLRPVVRSSTTPSAGFCTSVTTTPNSWKMAQLKRTWKYWSRGAKHETAVCQRTPIIYLCGTVLPFEKNYGKKVCLFLLYWNHHLITRSKFLHFEVYSIFYNLKAAVCDRHLQLCFHIWFHWNTKPEAIF